MTTGDVKKYYGTYRGIVTSNKDPQGHRRLKVKIPMLTGSGSSNWAWPLENSNLRSQVPDVGDGVWVSFESGDPSYPIWCGTYGKPKSGKRVNIKTLSDSQSLSGITNYIVTEKTGNGSTEVDLVASLIAMANRIVYLEQQLALKAPISHSHP